MKQAKWMVLGVLAVLATAGAARTEERTRDWSASSKPAFAAQQCNTEACPAEKCEGYQNTVNLLTCEALTVAERLCRTGRYAEAAYLLEKVHRLNPDNRKVEEILDRIYAVLPRPATRAAAQPCPCPGDALNDYTLGTRSASAICTTQVQGDVVGSPCAPCAPAQAKGSCPAQVQVPGVICTEVLSGSASCCSERTKTTGCQAGACTASAKCACGDTCGCAKKCKCGDSSKYKKATFEIRCTPGCPVATPSPLVRSCPVLNGRIQRGVSGAATVAVPQQATVYVIVIPQSAPPATQHPQVIRIQPTPAMMPRAMDPTSPSWGTVWSAPPCTSESCFPTYHFSVTGDEESVLQLISHLVSTSRKPLLTAPTTCPAKDVMGLRSIHVDWMPVPMPASR